MTPSVADQTSTPAKDWRRHTDPPSLWVGVAIGSISLHLIAFWLIGLYQSSLSRRSQNQAAIPIEFVDISPSSKSRVKAKTVSPKLPLSNQKSVPAQLPKTAPITPTNQDAGAINSLASLQKRYKTQVSQPNRQPFTQKTDPKPTPTPTPQSTFQPQPRPIPTPIPKVPLDHLRQREEIKLGKGTPLPSTLPSLPPQTSTGSGAKTPGNLPNPTRTTSPTPTGNTPQTPTSPTGEQPQTSTGGASVAIIAPLHKDEVNQLIQQGILRANDLIDVMAVYQGSKTKQFDVSILPRDSGLQTAKILASLLINQNGNFQEAKVIQIEPTTLETEKSRYQQVLNDVFRTEKFIPAQNSDRTKPELSNLYIWMTIKPASPN